MMKYKGGCHCGVVRFEVEAPEKITGQDCNCSICTMSAYLHLIVAKKRFNLLQGQENLACYTFGSNVAKHYFCKTCGIKSFYIPRSNPDGYDINIRCLDQQPQVLTIEKFDGQNWGAHAHSLAHLSDEKS